MKKRVMCLAAALLLALPAACASRTEPGEDGLRLWFAVPGRGRAGK